MAFDISRERLLLRSETCKAKSEAAAEPPARPRRRGRFSPLTRRILAVNVLALAILVAGLLYVGEYRRSLVASELDSMAMEAAIIAGALGEGAVEVGSDQGQQLVPEPARQMLRRMMEPSGIRGRLFAVDGRLLADSRVLAGPGGAVQIAELPPPASGNTLASLILDLYERLVLLLPAGEELPPYLESDPPTAGDYAENAQAFAGEAASAVRGQAEGGMILSVAVPVQHYKQVLGSLMLTKSGVEIEQALRAVQIDILKVFCVALAVTVLLSLYLASTIARPVSTLATAADQVRGGRGRAIEIPDFSERGDEIGDLSGSLREMTEALWQRMDAIESFAADVSHEIKNPLTSLRSAVETAARVEDPEQQRRLMGIIQEDVARLDRLISDISDASRLDAELSRAQTAPVDLAGMLTALVEVQRVRAGEDPDAPELELDLAQPASLTVTGIEGRLAQVFQNLIANAVSFSPPGGTIRIAGRRESGKVRITVDDDGPGIPDDMTEAIFDRFYSERPSGEKFGTHSGLGLSISKEIVLAHKGEITAENRRDGDGAVRGARFVILLPAGSA